MSFRRRLIRILLIAFLIIAVAGYGAVSTLLINPLEGSYEYDLSTLIPRDVEFYASKADLEGDFDPFPHLGVLEDLENARGGQALAATQVYRDWKEELDLTTVAAEIDASMEQMPIEVSALGLFGGSDLAVAGYFQGSDLARARWAAYGRTNFFGRVGVELLRYPGAIGLTDQGFVVEEIKDDEDLIGHSISGGQLTETLHICRVLDVVVVSNDPSLIRRARALEAERGKDSLGQSAQYGDHIDVANRTGEELEFFIRQRKLAENMNWAGDWPDAESEDSFFQAFWGKLFQIGAMGKIAGSCGFGNGFDLRLHGELASDKMTKEQKRLYRQQGFERRKGEQVARLAPNDVGLFLLMNGDVGDLLRAMLKSVNPDELTLIEDRVREVWGYGDALPLVEDLDAAFRDQFAFLVRNHDYEPETGDNAPVQDGTPVLSWALVLWPKDLERVEKLEKRVQTRQGAFGIQGREPGTPGVFSNTLDGGSKIFEYHQPFVPGTGMIATLKILSSDRYFLISNSHNFLNDINSTFYGRQNARPQLAEQPYFQSYVLSGLGAADALLWLNPRAISESMRTIAEFQAGIDVRSGIDWDTVRPQILRRILREQWPNENPNAVSPEVQPQLDLLYDEEATKYTQEYIRTNASILLAEYMRGVEMWEVMECAMVQLSIDQKALDLTVRTYMPLD